MIAVFYLAVTICVVMNIHYCMGKISSISFSHDKVHDDGTCSKCGMSKTENHCCKDDVKTVKLNDSHQASDFAFELALMEEHFNEHYVESSKYPKAEFKGEIKEIGKVDFTKDGTYTVKVKGKLTMHGESNDVEAEAKIVIQGGKIKATADFNVKLADYKVSIPGLVADKVAKVAKIGVTCSLELLKS